MGGSFMDMTVLYKEMARAALPSPHLSAVMMCGQVILNHSTCAKDVSNAKIYTSAVCRHVALEGHQIHAGVALLEERDLQCYSRRAMAVEYCLGNNEFHQTIAHEMGLTYIRH